jgi:hypothetical protein
MRRLLAILILAALGGWLLWSQDSILIVRKKAAASCTTPTGTTLTESFGDSSTSCWTSGPSTCNNTWTINLGTAHSIINSPGTPPANTSCTKSLQIAQAGAEAEVYIALGKAAATPMDWYGEVYLTSHSLDSYATADLVGFSLRASLSIFNAGGDLYLIGRGSSNSEGTLITTGTWYKVRVHLEAGANASYVSVNDGASDTFTQNAETATNLVIGANDTVTYTAVYGYMRVD